MSLSNDDFYVVLPSNVASNNDKRNTPSEYLTQLHSVVNFEGDSRDWEVALVEMSFVNALKTIDVETLAFQVLEKETRRQMYIHSLKIDKKHISIAKIGNSDYEVIDLPELIVTDTCEFHYDADLNRYTFDSKVAEFGKMTLSINIAITLGFHPDIVPENADNTAYHRYDESNLKFLNLRKKISTSITKWTAPSPPVIHTIEGKRKLVLRPGPTSEQYDAFKPGQNIYQDVETWISKVSRMITIPGGHYKTPEDLAHAVNEASDIKTKYGVTLLYDLAINRFIWELPRQDDLTSFKRRLRLIHMKGLHDILGFNTQIIGITQKAQHPPDLRRGIYSLYVYCDICADMRVGNALVPLLRNVAFPTTAFGETIHIIYNNPIYVQCNKRTIDTIQITICDDAGHRVPFVEGKTTVMIHIQKRV